MKLTSILATAAVAATAVSAQETDVVPFIVGGTEVPIGTKTWTVSLRGSAGGRAFCGGTLISPTWVLSAAHCAGGIKFVSVGSHYLSGTTDGQQIAVKREIVNPKYDADLFTYDTMIIELAEPAKFEPLSLIPVAADVKEGEKSTVIGWGTTSEGGMQSNVKLQVDVAVWSNEKCNQTGDLAGNIDETMFCAGGEAGKDSCQGDSGGPITVVRNGKDVLAGVVSWGIGCARPNLPGVYNRVSTSLEWIYENVPGLRPIAPTPTPSPTPEPTSAPTPAPSFEKGILKRFCAKLNTEETCHFIGTCEFKADKKECVVRKKL